MVTLVLTKLSKIEIIIPSLMNGFRLEKNISLTSLKAIQQNDMIFGWKLHWQHPRLSCRKTYIRHVFQLFWSKNYF